MTRSGGEQKRKTRKTPRKEADSGVTVETVTARMEFDENNLLPDLFGVHNANLARIERALDVVLSPRGNQLNLEGPENAVQMTSVVLNSLYDLLQKGRSVDMAEVEAALRIADQAERTNGDSRDELAHAAAIVVRTHKRHISPRSATQAAYM
ncbi:MAG: PhoH family protein, partial [Rhodospirillales bacterium]|nr:PhoH family protein [Rhodospirillales bacterium]